ncbi:glycoside hydrolase superfamily [Podospora australis]|uniref:Glycoside hydrolase superfamily n=1 Tax=Podospora australis TaxID=1536484 RepID=A0AAN7ALP2_9PEZI|nr:glycoside hydrolase superfamily [Podospora australis]
MLLDFEEPEKDDTDALWELVSRSQPERARTSSDTDRATTAKDNSSRCLSTEHQFGGESRASGEQSTPKEGIKNETEARRKQSARRQARQVHHAERQSEAEKEKSQEKGNSGIVKQTQQEQTSEQNKRMVQPRRSMILFVFVLGIAFLASWLVYRFQQSEAELSIPWIPSPDARLFSQRPLPPVNEKLLLSSSEYKLPLQTKGRDIVDQNGNRFKLSSVNWYGASDELFIPGGLDIQHRDMIANTIKKLGFNSVRMPYSDEMVMTNPTVLPHLLTANPDLIGKRALDIFVASVEALTDAGLAVIINNHITSAVWCCGADPCDAGWANDHLGPLCRVKQTEEQWIEHWETVMERFLENPLVIGADLRNEVRGLWGTMPWDKWATAAEKCGNKLLKLKKDWLIIVEGTESANHLRYVGKRPVVLDVPNRVVYSAHVYSWSGWGSSEGRYSKRTYASFVDAMRTNWAYLVEDDIAPVWIGEFGAPNHPGQGDANYWANLMRYLKAIDADFGYWAVNPRKPKDNEKESYSLVKDDWVTPVLDYRLKDMTELMVPRKT